MEVLALVFGSALVVLMALVIRGIATTRRNGWTARTDAGSDSSWMFMGAHSSGSAGESDRSGSTGGSDCSSLESDPVAAARTAEAVATAAVETEEVVAAATERPRAPPGACDRLNPRRPASVRCGDPE